MLVYNTCHFLTMEQYLSLVRFIPWKLVRQFLPCTSSTIRRNLRNATSSFCRSARETSNTRPFSASEAISENTPKKMLIHIMVTYSDDCEEVPIRGTCTRKSLQATRLPPSSFAGSERASSSEFRGVSSAIILSPKPHAINALRGAFMRKI